MKTHHLFFIIMGGALGLRLILALAYPHYWGVDGGASILNALDVLGRETTDAGWPKPALAPGWTLVPFLLSLGPDVGYKVWSAFFAILPIIPVFLLTRKLVGDTASLFASVFAAVDITWGEMFVAGAHPLPAFACLGMAWLCMSELSQRITLRYMILLALSVGLIPWLNQTTAGLALILLPAYWLSMLAFDWHERKIILWYTIPPLFIGGMIGIAALPWYLDTLPGSSLISYDGPLLYWAWDWSTFQAFVIALPIGTFVLWKAQDARIKALAVVLLVMGVMVNFMSFDEALINPSYRARYAMALAVYPLVTWICWRYWLPRVNYRLAWGLGLAVFFYVAPVFLYVVHSQNQNSLMISKDTEGALKWLKEHDPSQGVATNSFTLSLWVAALNQVKSPFAFTAAPPPYYVEADANLRCLYNWVDQCNPMVAAHDLGVKYLLIEERFPYYNDRVPGNYLAPPDQWTRTAQATWLTLIYSQGTVKLWQVVDSKSLDAVKAQGR